MARTARILGALVLLVVGAPLIYMFGAGFFSGIGIGLPTPWNLIATVALGLILLISCWSLLTSRPLYGPVRQSSSSRFSRFRK